MKYISEERLREKFRSLYWSNGTEEELLKALINECKELNQWQQIDENTPRDRRILLLYEDGDVRIDWWYHESQQSHNKIVAWTELPETPK